MGLGAAAFAAKGAPNFTDAGSLAVALQNYGGRALGDMFAVALLDASIIGAFAVSLSTAYAIGDVFKINHSLHRGVKQAKGFYGVYAGVVGLAAGFTGVKALRARRATPRPVRPGARRLHGRHRAATWS